MSYLAFLAFEHGGYISEGQKLAFIIHRRGFQG